MDYNSGNAQRSCSSKPNNSAPKSTFNKHEEKKREIKKLNKYFPVLDIHKDSEEEIAQRFRSSLQIQLFAPKSTFTERKAKRAIKKLNIYFPVQDNDKYSMEKKLHKILGFQHKNNSLH